MVGGMRPPPETIIAIISRSQLFFINVLAPPPLPPKNVPTTGPSSTDDAGMSYFLYIVIFHLLILSN